MTGGTLSVPRPEEQGTHRHRFTIPVEWDSWPAYDEDGDKVQRNTVKKLRCECGTEETR